MTTISKMELIDRMKKRLIESKEDHNRLINSLNKHNQRILKNLKNYSSIEKSYLKIEDSLQELVNKLNVNMRSAEISIINTEHVDIEEIFRLFYQNKPPFSSKEKKRFEFPDAFILKSVDNWCKHNKTKMIFLTQDKDFNGYKSRNLLFRDNLKSILSDISVHYDSKQKEQTIPFIKEQLKNNRKDLTEIINEEIQKLVSFEINYEKFSKVEFNVQIKKEEITAIRKQFAEVSCSLNLNYGFTVLPTEHDVNKHIFEESFRQRKVRGKINVSCELEVALKQKNGIKIKWINSNQKIVIRIDN